jgi:4-hydroxy-3-methylbut-2-enyl diphosphate reductase
MKSFNVPATYRSPLITAIKQKRKLDDRMKRDFTPTPLDFGPLKIFLARHFGFCYGVENAIEIAFRTVEENPGRRIFLLSEMIHNPFVNADLQAKGVSFLMDTGGRELVSLDSLGADDIVLIPAFGTTLDIERRLKEKGIRVENHDTTCPFVEKVWNRSEQIAGKGYSVVVHGKPTHEETRATFSHSEAHAPTIVVKDMKEARRLGRYIIGELAPEGFTEEFKGRFNEGFDFQRDLSRIGVVNQTTMLASDTQAIADHLRQVMMDHYGLDETNIHERFADTRDTLCYATMDNQQAVSGLLEQEADLAVVVGGRNSSNTSHLVELCEQRLPTWFVRSADDMTSRERIVHGDWRTHQGAEVTGWLPDKGTVSVLLTSGASCPDAMVEGVIRRLAKLVPGARSFEDVLQEWAE